MLQVWGSGNLTQTLLKSDPIDALRLRTFPIAEGSGKRLGAEVTMPDSFELIKKKG
jgi:dihydrofolate reductase